MDHCHVIVKANTTWKEYWIFKKSGIDIYWFIFTTDTCTLLNVHVHYQNKWSNQTKFSRCWIYCLLYVGSVVHCICPSTRVLVWVLLYGCFFYFFLFFVFFLFCKRFYCIVSCHMFRPTNVTLLWLSCNLLTSQWFCGNTEKNCLLFKFILQNVEDRSWNRKIVSCLHIILIYVSLCLS